MAAAVAEAVEMAAVAAQGDLQAAAEAEEMVGAVAEAEEMAAAATQGDLEAAAEAEEMAAGVAEAEEVAAAAVVQHHREAWRQQLRQCGWQ